jgi:membrane protease YdiL (CAAX protease family)
MAAVVGALAALHLYRITAVSHWDALIQALVISFSAGVSEELLFRGVLFKVTEEWLGSWWALALSAAFFGAAHLLNPHATPTAAIAIMIEAGIMLAAAYLLTRRLWLPIGIHAGWNFTQGGIFGIAVSGTTSPALLQSQLTGPSWLSGGEFGAEASIIAVAFSGTLGVLLLMRSVRTGGLIASRRHRVRALAPPLSGA